MQNTHSSSIDALDLRRLWICMLMCTFTSVCTYAWMCVWPGYQNVINYPSLQVRAYFNQVPGYLEMTTLVYNDFYKNNEITIQ